MGSGAMLIVVAIGGNALLRRGETPDVETQRQNISAAVAPLAKLAEHHQIVITHGNGPQVGLLALQSSTARDTPAYPLDVLGAESEGMIGYLLEEGLRPGLGEQPVATLLTQVVVDASDPAFAHPTKPIGPTYTRAEAEGLAAERGWSVAPDGDRWRRVVASPEPRAIVELDTIRMLVAADVVTICVGGGGIPVVLGADGALQGVEAVIDKDRSAALLARELGAGMLLLLTDVPFLERHHGTPIAHPIESAGASELDPEEFEEGTMRPKVQAVAEFARETGCPAAIGALADAEAIVAGRAGTRVLADHQTPILATERAMQRLGERTEQLELDADTAARLAEHSYKPVYGTGPAPKREIKRRR